MDEILDNLNKTRLSLYDNSIKLYTKYYKQQKWFFILGIFLLILNSYFAINNLIIGNYGMFMFNLLLGVSCSIFIIINSILQKKKYKKMVSEKEDEKLEFIKEIDYDKWKQITREKKLKRVLTKENLKRRRKL